MSCNKLNTILLGGKKGADGKYPVHREILFTPAGKLVADALPEQCALLYARQQNEPELDGIPSVACADDADFTQMIRTAIEGLEGDIMLLSTPMPDVTAEEYQLTIDQYRGAATDVTTMTCSVITADDTWHAAIFHAKALHDILEQHPLSLMHAIGIAHDISAKVGTCRTAPHTAVYTAKDAYQVQKALQNRINTAWMEKGVSIFDPEHTYISPYSEIGSGTTILPGCMIHPGSTIGCGCTIGPNTVLDRASVGDRTSVNSSQIYESSVGADATVGPFAYIRPGSAVGNETRIGDFVELKNAHIGNGTKVSHLTYIGDAEVGEHVNFGCGTVVVNYDGYTKSKTVIGDNCFIGCNTNLVAPVELGDRVLTAAGTTVTRNVPDGAMAVARVRQENKEGWNDRRRRMHGQK